MPRFAALLSGHAEKLTGDGERLVRHGHLPKREIMTGIGAASGEAGCQGRKRFGRRHKARRHGQDQQIADCLGSLPFRIGMVLER
jgi:hypothetical protein